MQDVVPQSSILKVMPCESLSHPTPNAPNPRHAALSNFKISQRNSHLILDVSFVWQIFLALYARTLTRSVTHRALRENPQSLLDISPIWQGSLELGVRSAKSRSFSPTLGGVIPRLAWEALSMRFMCPGDVPIVEGSDSCWWLCAAVTSSDGSSVWQAWLWRSGSDAHNII